MVKRIAVLTTTRADYGILKPLIQALRESAWAQPILLATGAHLMASQGETVREIEADGMPIAARIPIFDGLGDRPLDKAVAFGRAGARLAPELAQHRPDALIVLGDRFETLAVAAAATLLQIPIIHLHGGEETAGALDDRFRHAISQLADWHLAATARAARRLAAMGIASARIAHVGALGVWQARHRPLLDRAALQETMPIPLRSPLFIVTYHPETATRASPRAQVQALIEALAQFSESVQIVTYANADAGGEVINRMWQAYARARKERTWLTPSLGRRRYHSMLALADVVVGNSSSGVLEAPAFGVPVVDIGERQAGRERASGVLHAPCEAAAIERTIREALRLGRYDGAENPYYLPDTLTRIMAHLQAWLT